MDSKNSCDEPSTGTCEADEDRHAFMRAVIDGLADLDAGRQLTLHEAKAKLGLT